MAFSISDLESVVGHWSADQITGASDGDPVSTLPDSISDWGLVASGAARPIYRPTGINSLPAVDFDGTDDYMETAAASSFSAGAFAFSCVVKIDLLKNYNSLAGLSTATGPPSYGSSSVAIMAFAYSSGNLLVRSRTPFVLYSSAVSSGSKSLITCIAGGRAISGLVDGQASATSSSTGTPGSPPAGNYYGSFGNISLANGCFEGLLSELVVWNETLLCESLYIEGVLSHKYGITLPSTHPFYASAPSSAPGSGSGNTMAALRRGNRMAQRGVIL